ncbi:putative bifunctional diguanylate cyclase/phosphodiesterase [Sphingorhabdus sp.]|uniref:putative bifunctional diguanylate cyclase/phosphodiesterase n=1 Tax=Sphingorhabdus sp. TaxID=1902408 RepID=UPI003594007D
MAVAKLFRNFPGVGSSDTPGYGSVAVITQADASRRLEVLDDFEHAGIGWLWATDAEARLIYISENAAEKLNRPIEDLLAQSLTTLFETDAENQGDRSDRPLNFQITARNKIIDQTVRFALNPSHGDGRQTWWSISGHPKFDKSGSFQGYRGSAKDITVEYERKLVDSRLAEFDSLTGLANRHRMDKKLDSILSAYKSAKRSCTLIMLDLDRFKHVNDTLGHPAGDDLLCQVARRLERVVGARGEIGRLGGDEFQIILPDLDDRGKLGEMANKIIQIVSQPYNIEDKRATIGTSIGIAISPYDGIGKLDLIHNADLALYAAKNGGRGQFRFYSVDLKDEAEERRLLEEGLRDALANDMLELHYQPVVRTEDNMVVTFEALMRWEHPERGTIGPDVFVPIAEESDLINQIGAWALNKACKDAMAWPKSVRVAVNVSAAQFAHSDLIDIVTHALESAGLEPNRLELELTESVFMGDGETIDDIFRALKELGVRLALDDFGTGYSSLSYLRSAPFDKIKVDRTFVDSCTQKDQNSAKIIAAIIGLSDALGMETTVEGVEAFDQLEVVKSKGARFIQGWIYSKALTQETVIHQLKCGDLRIEPDGPERHRPERRSVFRRIGVIHDDHRYDALMRNLSKTGALIDGLLGVPEGTGLVLDLGGGQLVVSIVTRAQDALIAVEFETPLVSDGAGGLCTRHRISPYVLAAAATPAAAQSKPVFMQVAALSSQSAMDFQD